MSKQKKPRQSAREAKSVTTVTPESEDEPMSTDLKQYVTTRQAADMLGVITTSVNHLLADGRLKGKKIGNYWLVYKPSIEKYIETKTPTGRPPSRAAKLQETQ
jgi:excisionase family DNA binding protein